MVLREVEQDDLQVFFQHQLDSTANRMAAFTAEDPADLATFLARWSRFLTDETIVKRTIIIDSHVVGHIMSFVQDGDTEVTYWIDRAYWGRGIASQALAEFLTQVTTRPVHARVAKDNIGSQKVLQRCGFVIVGEDSGFAHGRGEVVEEFVLQLTA
ncbi:GNAT family N-acetyltransferase [Micromonospora sonneratiae]|uniref:GNAT family N-acetyltransferase n=1 Tax=Micromonospora sonneratiae TaxID=1184706 RepID=A0ABW3YPF6_9ACTN